MYIIFINLMPTGDRWKMNRRYELRMGIKNRGHGIQYIEDTIKDGGYQMQHTNTDTHTDTDTDKE